MTKEELEKDAEGYGKKATAWLEDREPLDQRDIENAYLAGAEPREKRIAELEAQIEKMKCCHNCRHSRTEYEHCKTDKHEKWEIKEK